MNMSIQLMTTSQMTQSIFRISKITNNSINFYHDTRKLLKLFYKHLNY